MIRFIYQGRELKDHETLRTYNIRDQTIIHCQISVRRHPTTTNSTRSDGMNSGAHINTNAFDTTAFFDASPVNISSHFVLLLSLILGFIWYLRIKYRALFSPISTIILILITIIFLIFTCGSLLNARRPVSNTGGHATIALTPVQHVHLNWEECRSFFLPSSFVCFFFFCWYNIYTYILYVRSLEQSGAIMLCH